MKKVKQYIQEKNLINHVQDYLKGKRTLIIVGSFQSELFIKKITSSLVNDYECIVFNEECTETVIQKLAEKMQKECFDSIIGFGGGKVLDTAKAVSYYYPCFLMMIPSSASMDGVCSALSVLYHEDHSFHKFLYLDKNPDVVLVDSEIIAAAPFSLLCAGMIDAVSSYYDVAYVKERHEIEEKIENSAKQCYRLFDLYEQAKKDYENKIISNTIETVIRTNLYDSARAFENVDCEFSHVLANATTKVKGSKGMHGERVGVSLLFMLYLLKQDKEAEKVKEMLSTFNMPMTLSDLCIYDESLLIENIKKELDEMKIFISMAAIEKELKKLR